MIPLWSSYVAPDAEESMARVLRSGWLNTGPEERAFREEFKALTGARHVIPTINGTTALKLALRAAGVEPGDEVVTTPYTFIATNTAILEVGATPVFADIDYETLCIDWVDVERKRRDHRQRTGRRDFACTIAVDYGGIPAAFDTLGPIIWDSAHALGTITNGISVGMRRGISIFSLQAVKVVTSGDGGVLTTDSDEYASRLQRLSWYGADKETIPTPGIDRMPEEISELGYKANMNDLTAALARSAIRALPDALTRRRQVGERYRAELGDLERTRLLRYDPWVQPNYQIFPVHVHDRPRFWKHMLDCGIQTAMNNRRNDRYAIFGGYLRDLPNVARADEDVILIPIHCALSDLDVEQVISAVREYDRL